jgi:hypothetical protein
MKRFVTRMLSIGALLCVGRWVDLAYFTDITTGLCVAGSVWLRYAVLALVGVLGALLAALYARRSVRGLARRCVPAGVAALVGAAALFAAGCAQLAAPGGVAVLAQAVLEILCAAWLVLAARSWLGAKWSAPAGGAAMGVAGSALFYWLVLLRFMQNSSSYHRVLPIERILAALVALLFLSALLRALLLPDSANGAAVCRGGVWCFWLCLCWEEPQAVLLFAAGQSDTAELLLSVGFCAVGALGGICATLCSGKKTAARQKS